MKALELIHRGLVAMGADGLVNADAECGCVLADLFACGECGCQCAPAKFAPCDRSTCDGDHDEGLHLEPMEQRGKKIEPPPQKQSEICRTTGHQACHCCDDAECSDNANGHAPAETQRERGEARAKLAAIAALLGEVGCDCDCGHDSEGHGETCERCLGCRIEALL